MAPIRVGFIGLSSRGWASNAHASLWNGSLNSQYTLTAVSTSSQASAAAAADAYSAKTGHTVKGYSGDPSEIARDDEVDVVDVSVKTPDHRAAALAAIAQKKDLFVEWPLGRSLAESKEIADAARAAGVRTIIGAQGWQSPVVHKIRHWIAAGEIGRVLSATWVSSKPAERPYFAPRTFEPDAYGLDASNGATFLSIFLGHNIATLTHMLGPLTSVTATSANLWETVEILGPDKEIIDTRAYPSPDHFAVSGPLRDHGGALFSGVWRHGAPADGRPLLQFIIDGDKGYISIESNSVFATALHIASPATIKLNGKDMPIDDTPFTGNVGRNWEAFAKGVPGTWPTFDDAVDIYKHLDAIERSANEGRRIDIGV